MENYIMLNGQRIDLTVEQIEKVKGSFAGVCARLSDVPVEETFKIGEYEFIVLNREGNETVVLLRDILCKNVRFGDSNNFIDSNVDKICDAFADEIESIIGKGKIIVHTVDLTSDDGLKCYKTAERRVSLLTADLYRRYVYILDKYKVDKYWWLVTPSSTPKHDGDNWVKCVAPSGNIIDDYYDNVDGVRPFLIFVSDISVSCKE